MKRSVTRRKQRGGVQRHTQEFLNELQGYMNDRERLRTDIERVTADLKSALRDKHSGAVEQHREQMKALQDALAETLEWIEEYEKVKDMDPNTLRRMRNELSNSNNNSEPPPSRRRRRGTRRRRGRGRS